MAAGHEATAITLSMCLCLIAKHPGQEKLIMEELFQMFGDSIRPCSIHDLIQLKYLECCLKETLRLYTPVPFVIRYLTEDVQTDPESFKPKRFLPKNRMARHQFALVPFRAGPRSCVGQKFAMLNLKVCLANWMRRYHFTIRDPSAPLDVPFVEVTLKSKQGVHLVVKK